MGSKTGIAWTDATWNPWMGCTRVSPGCANCYMFREQERYGWDPSWLRRSKTTFRAPLGWAEPRRVFTCSWSDFFHEGADAWRPEAWEIIRTTPHLTYQVLTKRPQQVLERLPPDWGEGYPNVWLGVSVENQRWAERADQLAQIPAVVRFVSAEPLLGQVDFVGATLRQLDWMIVGGETGGDDRRAMGITWVESLLRQCRAYGVAFFFKQRSGPKPGLTDGVPADLLVREFPR